MKTSILNTEFNFAKSINLSLIATTPNAYPSYPQGIKEFITPYLEALQDTIIPDHLTLVSIQTIDHEDSGVHILTLIKNDLGDTPSACHECLRDTFYYDPEVCYGSSPIINKFESLYTVTVPFTC